MKVLNFGSLNLDYTYKVPHIVIPGETITSISLNIYPGGKGLNQSVALAKAGADVYHAGMIGEDGTMLKQICEKNGVRVPFIRYSETRTGNAIIQVDDNGQNCIILYPGANRQIQKEFIKEVLENFKEGDILLLQNEINHLPYIIDCAYDRKIQIILNPSPFDEQILECDLKKISMFILNEVEGKQMTDEIEPEKILGVMKKMYPESKLVLTLGEKGSVYCSREQSIQQDIFLTKVEDTTGAGDTFTGYFISDFFKGKNPKHALKIASMASSIAVSRKGAASAIPSLEEVVNKLEDYEKIGEM